VVRFLDSDSLRAFAVGRLRASSGSEAAGPEAAGGWAACVSLAAHRSPRSSLPASRLSPADLSSGRLQVARRTPRRCRLARTRPRNRPLDPASPPASAPREERRRAFARTRTPPLALPPHEGRPALLCQLHDCFFSSIRQAQAFAGPSTCRMPRRQLPRKEPPSSSWPSRRRRRRQQGPRHFDTLDPGDGPGPCPCPRLPSKMAKYEKNRSTRRSTPRHPIAMASTAKPPDPMPCALASILLPESLAPACHMRKTLFPGQASHTKGRVS